MISFQNLTFTYPGAVHPALQDITLQIPSGELCLVMGPSGSGKSTLLRCINGLVPHFSGGKISGLIQVNDRDPVRYSPREMSKIVGFVFQDPEAQFVVDYVEDEIAFSLENASMNVHEMETRIDDVLKLLGLNSLRKRRLESLSGGERQRVAIAAALALQPQILVLDEPTSQLDPHGAEEVLQSLMDLNKQLGLTIVLAEHRLERVLPFTGQIIYLSDESPGLMAGKPRDILAKVPLGPPVTTLGKAFGWDPLPLTVEEARDRIGGQFLTPPAEGIVIETSPRHGIRTETSAFLQANNVVVKFDQIQALNGVTLGLYPGEITVMMGHNGSGKTTLLRSLVGLATVQDGNICVAGEDISGKTVSDICQKVGYLPQDPNALLFADTVLDELLITLHNHQLDPTSSRINPYILLDILGLADKAGDYPRDLSTGERQRVALGAIMVSHPGALLLDEPTRGLDYAAKQILLDLLRRWRDEGMVILLVTHDVELAAQAADRIIILENGMIVADGSPEAVLPSFPTFTPQVAKIYPHRGWLTVDDAIGGMHAS